MIPCSLLLTWRLDVASAQVFTGLNNSHATPFPQARRARAPPPPRLASLSSAVRPLHSLEHEIPRQVLRSSSKMGVERALKSRV